MRKVLAGFVSLRRLIGFIGLIIVFAGCIKREEWEIIRYRAPNWTSDGRRVFMQDHYIQKWEETPVWGGIRPVGGHQEIFVCEIDVDGSNFRQVRKIVDEEFERGRNHMAVSTSSASEYIVISKEDGTKGEHYTEMFLMKRDGTGFKNLGEGSWPDLSPDGKKIVYQKPNQGLWIKNIDGSGDRQIAREGAQPAWSPDGRRIAYTIIPTGAGTGWLMIADTMGNNIIDFSNHGYNPGFNTVDWAPLDSNAIITQYYYEPYVIYLEDSLSDRVVENAEGYGWHWSSNGEWLCSQTNQGILVIKVDGSNKHYIKP